MFRTCLYGEDDPRNPAVLDERERLLDKRESLLSEREASLSEKETSLSEKETSLAAREEELRIQLADLEEGRRALLREKQRLGLAEATGDNGVLAGTDDDNVDDVDDGGEEEGPEAYPDSGDVPVPPEDGACYLAYEPDSSGRLVERYSRSPVRGAIGRWATCGDKKISGFKFKSDKGKTLIAGCGGGTQGRKNYFSGWCQFLRAACHMDSTVMVWDIPEGKKGLPVDVWVYTSDERPGRQSVKLRPGIGKRTEDVLAIAVLPKGTSFYDQAMTIDIKKWLSEGNHLGGSMRI